MEVVKIKDEIQKRINLLDAIRGEVKKRADAKAISIAEYDKQIAIVLIQLKEGEPFDIDGKTIKGTPTTLCKDVAKGVCWHERLKMEQAIAAYNSANTNLDVVRAQLNGYQSILKYLDEG
jgi:hypothetical protein